MTATIHLSIASGPLVPVEITLGDRPLHLVPERVRRWMERKLGEPVRFVGWVVRNVELELVEV